MHKIYTHPNKHIPCQTESWQIEGEQETNELARVTLEDKDYSYSIYFDAAGKPRLNIWTKINDEISEEIHDESIELELLMEIY